MKLHKFERFFSAHRWLRPYLGAPCLSSTTDADEYRRLLKRYVQEELEFVALRPFRGLDLSAVSTESFTRIPHPRYENLQCSRGERTDYIVQLHIEGPDKPFGRARYVVDGNSIADVITHLVDWHAKYWAGQNCPLRLDAVVKRTTRSDDAIQSRKERIEVYPFPADFDIERFRSKIAA